jgi:hypothetical protein
VVLSPILKELCKPHQALSHEQKTRLTYAAHKLHFGTFMPQLLPIDITNPIGHLLITKREGTVHFNIQAARSKTCLTWTQYHPVFLSLDLHLLSPRASFVSTSMLVKGSERDAPAAEEQTVCTPRCCSSRRLCSWGQLTHIAIQITNPTLRDTSGRVVVTGEHHKREGVDANRSEHVSKKEKGCIVVGGFTWERAHLP